MLAYVIDVLTRFRHNNPQKPQHQPHPHNNPNYGAKAQYAEAEDVSTPLSIADKKIVQEVTGNFLYYMLTSLGYIVAQQANPPEYKIQKVKQLLDYAATHPDAIITYHASDMVLAVHINTSYLSEKNTEADKGDISSCQTTRRSLPTMEQC